MRIRAATDEDIPSIVQLLKLSLGESLMPKSEEFWRWKHIDNPFGKSPVLLALEGEHVVGVRAFMRWEWRLGGQIYKAVRAVDTATHPLHQGRGIFRELTMQLINQCQEEGISFIYNTPNKISLPGYIKMGWQKAGRLPMNIKIHAWKNTWFGLVEQNAWSTLDNHPLLNQSNPVASLVTHINGAYFRWRYRDNPNATYRVLSSTGDRPFLLFYRIKEAKNGIEVRITDLLCSQYNIGYAVRCLQSTISGVKVITFSSAVEMDAAPGFIKLPIGPIVTIRNLNMSGYPESLSFERWSPSLGDLELF